MDKDRELDNILDECLERLLVKGETIEQAARREAAEEIGATLGQMRLVGVYTNFYESKSDHVVVFSCNDFTVSGETDSEIETYGLFGLNDLPACTSPGTLRRIEEYLARPMVPSVDTW